MIGINDFNPDTVAGMLFKRAARLPNKTVYCFPEHEQTYDWLRTYTETRAIAESLINTGIKKGDRIAILMEGRMEVILSIYSAASIGAIAVPLNTYSKKEELISYFNDAKPAVLIMGSKGRRLEYLPIIQEIITEANDTSWLPAHIFVLDDENEQHPFRKFSELLDRSNLLSAAQYTAVCKQTFTDDGTLLIYTSGTTGVPKGVLRSTASLISQNKQSKNKGPLRGFIASQVDKIANKVTVIQLFPMYHLGGLAILFTTLKATSIRVVMLTHFNPVNAVNIIEKEKCFFMVGSPYMIQNMVTAVPDSAGKLGSIKGIAFASAAINNTMIEKITARFTSLTFFLVSYGSSEAGAIANGICFVNNNTNLSITLLLRFLTAVNILSGNIKLKEFNKTTYSIGGRVAKDVVVKIRDVANGAYLPMGQQGEIVVKSHRVMRYINETPDSENHLSNGYYRSGDLGYLTDKGLVVITGRIKRLISRGGEKIAPAEIEYVILRNHAIADVFVLGIPDELYGEQICAAIVVKDGMSVDIPALEEEILSNLSNFKLPKYFITLPEFPLSPTGKVATGDITNIVLQKIADGSVST